MRFVLPSLLLLGACTVAEGDAESDVTEIADGVRACVASARYDVVLTTAGGCVSLPLSSGGTWVPQTLFGTHDASAADTACTFELQRARVTTAAVDALRDHVAGFGGVESPSCSSGAPHTLRATVDDGPPPTVPNHGCDVCRRSVRVMGSSLVGVVAPESGFSRVSVSRSDGQSVRLLVNASPGAFRARLPIAPRGTHWIEGPVRVD